MREIRAVLQILDTMTQKLFPTWDWRCEVGAGSEQFVFRPHVPVFASLGRLYTEASVTLTDFERLSEMFAVGGIGVQKRALPPAVARQIEKAQLEPVGRLLGGFALRPDTFKPQLVVTGDEIFEVITRRPLLLACGQRPQSGAPAPLKRQVKPYVIGG